MSCFHVWIAVNEDTLTRDAGFRTRSAATSMTRRHPERFPPESRLPVFKCWSGCSCWRCTAAAPGPGVTAGRVQSSSQLLLTRILHEGGVFVRLDLMGHFAAHIRDGDWLEMASEGASEQLTRSRESVFEPQRCLRT